MGKKYIFTFGTSNNLKYKNTALLKPKLDGISIAEKHGYKSVINIDNLYYNRGVRISSIKGKFFQLLTLISISYKILSLKKDDVALYQYPFYSARLSKLIKWLLRHSKSKTVFYIHDLQFVQKTQITYLKESDERELLKDGDYVIVHNNKMGDLLSGGRAKLLSLSVFDYLAPVFDDIKIEKTKESYSVVFAGNFEKASFVKLLPKFDNFQFHLYGINYTDEIKNDSCVYHGVLSPEELASEITNYSFGLVWDGSSIGGLNGISGEYMKFNNPFKLSNYLASGLPIITSKDAAISDFIISEGLGICLTSLSELVDIKLTREEYLNMKENVVSVGRKIANGDMLGDILEYIDVDMKSYHLEKV